MPEQNYGPAATSTSPRAYGLPPLLKASDANDYTVYSGLGKVVDALSRPDTVERRRGKRRWLMADCTFCEALFAGPGYLCEELPPSLRRSLLIEPLSKGELFYRCRNCSHLGFVGGRQ